MANHHLRLADRSQSAPVPVNPGSEGERGTAVVELSIAVVILLTLVFGIITFGMILSFKQSMTQAAAEGVRAGAMGTAATAAGLAATSAEKSAGAFGKTCASDGDGLTCTPTVATCSPGPATASCITVLVEYDYEHYPLLPKIPLISAFLPDTLTSKSVSEVNS